MPVIPITDYTWRQTVGEIIITIPIKGNLKKNHIIVIDNYVKVNYPPFILELFLFENVVEEESQCTMGESSAVFILKKMKIGLKWPSLTHQDLTKEKKQEYRNQAMERLQLLAVKKAKEKSEKQQELQRQAVRKQIELDTATLNEIENIRNCHRREAMEDMEKWRILTEKPDFIDARPIKAPLECLEYIDDVKSEKILTSQDKCKIKIDNLNVIPMNEVKNTNNSAYSKSNPVTINKINDEKIYQHTQNIKDKDSQRRKEIIDKLLNKKYRTCKQNISNDVDTNIPKPRQTGTINVKFSERVFPTPARESYHLEEQEWLEKQVEARRKCGFVSDDLRPEEQNPQWLKDKGDEFFKAGNYIAAISAYTHGIKLSDKMTSLYANRSAAQYAIGNYRRCIEDCSTALTLMVPKCQGNCESRARCHARLGAALCKLSAPQHGIPELEAALKLAPDNDSIKRDLDEAKKFF